MPKMIAVFLAIFLLTVDDSSAQEPEKLNQRFILSVDIPLVQNWQGIDPTRINDGTAISGSSVEPWVSNLSSQKWFVPKISFNSKYINLLIEGGAHTLKDRENNYRVDEFQSFELEGTYRNILAGIGGLEFRENISQAIKGLNFNADFSRYSSKRQVWLGYYTGKFTDTYLSIGYGLGDIDTLGYIKFVLPDAASRTDKIPLYSEEYLFTMFFVKFQNKINFIKYLITLKQESYSRVEPAPDTTRFGKDRFREVIASGEVEITPLAKVDFVKLVITNTHNFGSRDSLIFKNDYPPLRVLLRFSFGN